MLAPEQRQAIDAYQALIRHLPALFEGRAMRPIVLDPQTLAEYVDRTGTMLGMIARTPYFLVLVDLVERPGERGEPIRFPYTRIVRRKQSSGIVGSAALAAIRDTGGPVRFVLVRQERHATGAVELAIPRGFASAGEDDAATALRELEEETGYTGRIARRLGTIRVDSGFEDGGVALFLVDVESRGNPRHDPREAIVGVETMTLDAIRTEIRAGRLEDAFTIAALGLYSGLS